MRGVAGAIVLASCLWSQPGVAQRVSSIDGQQLLHACTSGDLDLYKSCSFYIIGSTDMLAVSGFSAELVGRSTIVRQICPPPTLDGPQTIDVVVQWLRNNPALADKQASYLIFLALRHAFPCSG